MLGVGRQKIVATCDDSQRYWQSATLRYAKHIQARRREQVGRHWRTPPCAWPALSMNKPIHILIVEDSEEDTELLLHELRRAAYEPAFERVDTPAAMSAALDHQNWDLVVADFSMPQFNALAALDLLNKRGLDLPFIIVSGTIGEELAVTAMKNGARDYIMKGNLKRLVPAVERELSEAVQRRQRKRAEEELRMTQEQFRVAREIQQRLFPKASPRSARFDIAGASHPAEAAGGDYFDYLPMADGCLGVVVADVSGHGVGPALLMAETRAYLRTLALNARDAGDVLTRANHALAEDVDFERFVTVVLARLDPRSQSLNYASAGHPSCYVLDGAGRVKATLKPLGVPLGMQPNIHYAASPVISLSTGDIMLLLTDGIEEAMSPEDTFFGVDPILDVVRAHSERSAEEIVEALFRAVRDFSQGLPQLDDLTVVVVKVKPSG
jgi:serine phosphatase RsbU (regulator of sigma subunit)